MSDVARESGPNGDRAGRGDPGAAGTVRGALILLVAALALGIAFNAFGRASRPPRGLAWIAKREAIPNLEALQPPATTDTAQAATPPPGTHAAATPEAHAAPAPAPHGTPAHAVATPPAGAAPAPPDTQASSSAPLATRRPLAWKPGGPAAGATSDLPVIPDLDTPVMLQMASLKKLYDADAVLILDAREAEEYAAGHIAGATNLPYNDALADPEKVKSLDSGGRPYVIYCGGGACELSLDLARLLLAAGRRKVLVYEGGYPEWQGAGYPVAKGADAGSRP